MIKGLFVGFLVCIAFDELIQRALSVSVGIMLIGKTEMVCVLTRLAVLK